MFLRSFKRYCSFSLHLLSPYFPSLYPALPPLFSLPCCKLQTTFHSLRTRARNARCFPPSARPFTDSCPRRLFCSTLFVLRQIAMTKMNTKYDDAAQRATPPKVRLSTLTFDKTRLLDQTKFNPFILKNVDRRDLPTILEVKSLCPEAECVDLSSIVEGRGPPDSDRW